MIKCSCELIYCFDKRRALHGPLSCLAPKERRFLDQTSFGAVPSQQLQLLTLGDLGELAFKGFRDAGIKCSPRIAQ